MLSTDIMIVSDRVVIFGTPKTIADVNKLIANIF